MFMTMHRLIFTALFFQYWDLLMKLFVHLISVLQLPPLHQHLDHLQFRNHHWIQLNQLRTQQKSNNLPTIGQLAPDSLFLRALLTVALRLSAGAAIDEVVFGWISGECSILLC